MNKILSLLVISSAVSAIAMEVHVEITTSDSDFRKGITLNPTNLNPTKSALGTYLEEMNDLNCALGPEFWNVLTEITLEKGETALNNEGNQGRRDCSSFDFGLVTPSTQNEDSKREKKNTLAPTESAVVAGAQEMNDMNANLSSSSTIHGPEYFDPMSLEF